MKIHYHSAPPMADTGYGVHTKNLLGRLSDDYEAIVHSVGGWDGMGIDWQGVQIYPPGGGKHGEQSIPYWFDKTGSDVVFSHHDHWSMADTLQGIQEGGIPMVLYTILDHDIPGGKPPEKVVQANENALKTIVMSEWAYDIMKQSRVPDEQIHQIPHGVDTTKYAPVTRKISKEELKEDLGVPEDSFLFGMVAANYGPRKNIPQHMEAFKRLTEDYDDVYLYIHTHPMMSGGYNLPEIRESLELERDRLFFPDAHEMQHGIEDIVIVQLLNTFDAHLNVTQSESWGLTITEALSCETPVIAANNSAQTEQLGVDYDTYVTKDEQFREAPNGLLVHRGAEMWTQNATARRFTSHVDDMEAAMRFAYNNRETMAEKGKNGRQWVKANYDWDVLYERHWKPFFEELEEIVDPAYGEWYFKRREAETQTEVFGMECQKILMEILGDEVLDVGCGTGTLLDFLEEHEYDVTGVEKHEPGVEMTREKDIECYQGDITDLEFMDDSFDTVISQHVLEHVEADVKAIAEMARVGRQRVISIVPTKRVVGPDPDETEVRRYDKEELERLREKVKEHAGLTVSYEKIRLNDNLQNWLITVDLEDEEETAKLSAEVEVSK